MIKLPLEWTACFNHTAQINPNANSVISLQPSGILTSYLKKSEKAFAVAYNTWAKKKGYRSSESKAKETYVLAKDGTPTLPSSMPSTKMLILEAARNLNTTNLTLATILSQMKLLASQLSEYSVVSAMKGVGERLNVLLIAEIGGVQRFHSESALVAYAGLDAPPYQSGTFMEQNVIYQSVVLHS